MQDFRDDRARWEFAAISAATFLAYLTGSTTALLAVLLHRAGMADQAVGVVLSAGSLPVAITALMAGQLMRRFGNLWPILCGIAVMALAHAALELAHRDAVAATLARVIGGIGSGVVVPAGMLYAQTRLTERRFVYLFGIYTTMLPLPNVFGPSLAELYLDHVGTGGFFLVTALPAALACGVVLWLLRRDDGPRGRGAGPPLGYLAALRIKDTRLVYASYVVFGVIWGFGASYMAVLLHQRGIAVAYFFSSFTFCLFAARFILLSKVQALSRDLVIVAGAVLQAVAYLLLWLVASPAVTMLVGLLYGLGHSVMFPSLTAWANSAVKPADRATTTALAQAGFTAGVTLCPLVGGVVVARLGVEALVLALSLMAFAMVALLGRRLGRQAA